MTEKEALKIVLCYTLWAGSKECDVPHEWSKWRWEYGISVNEAYSTLKKKYGLKDILPEYLKEDLENEAV